MSQRPGRARLLAIVRQCLGPMRGSIALAAAGPMVPVTSTCVYGTAEAAA